MIVSYTIIALIQRLTTRATPTDASVPTRKYSAKFLSSSSLNRANALAAMMNPIVLGGVPCYDQYVQNDPFENTYESPHLQRRSPIIRSTDYC